MGARASVGEASWVAVTRARDDRKTVEVMIARCEMGDGGLNDWKRPGECILVLGLYQHLVQCLSLSL